MIWLALAVLGYLLFRNPDVETRGGVRFFAESARAQIIRALDGVSLEPAQVPGLEGAVAFRCVKLSPLGVSGQAPILGAKASHLMVFMNDAALVMVNSSEMVEALMVVAPPERAASIAGEGSRFAVLFDPSA